MYWLTAWNDVRCPTEMREITLRRNTQRHLGQLEDWIFWVSLAMFDVTSFPAILSGIGCHFKRSVDTLIVMTTCTCRRFNWRFVVLVVVLQTAVLSLLLYWWLLFWFTKFYQLLLNCIKKSHFIEYWCIELNLMLLIYLLILVLLLSFC